MSYLFESRRLGFRELTRADLDNLSQLNSDPEVMKHVDARRAATLDETKVTLERILAKAGEWGKGLGFWMVEEKSSGDFVGWFALKPLPGFNEIELGYRLMRKHWGKGFATEGGRRLIQIGFGELKLPKIVAITDQANAASQGVLRKLGFSPQGLRTYTSAVTELVSEVSYFELLPGSMPKPKILLVVDNWELLERYEESLSAEAEVTCAPLGPEGVRMAREHLPDLIVLNLVFENMTNEEACDALRSEPATSSIPIVAVGNGGPGPDHWISGPLVNQEILALAFRLFL